MSTALRLVDISMSDAETLSPPARVSTMVPAVPAIGIARRPSLRPSLRPTFVPTSRATVVPSLTGSSATEPPTTQRSATVHPRFEAAARHEAANLLASMRMNVDFLQSLLHGDSSSLAATALDDIHRTIDRLERRFGAGPSKR